MYADGYVALEDDTTAAGMVVGSRHLGMQDILHEVVVSHLGILGGAWGGESCAVGLIPRRMTMPTAEVGGARGVAEPAILGVGHQPLGSLVKKGAEGVGGHHLCTLLVVEFMEIGFLGLHHALIVYLIESVELLAYALIVVAAAGRGKRRQLAQVGILRMQGKDADAAVGIAVGPGVGHGSIVDG